MLKITLSLFYTFFLLMGYEAYERVSGIIPKNKTVHNSDSLRNARPGRRKSMSCTSPDQSLPPALPALQWLQTATYL